MNVSKMGDLSLSCPLCCNKRFDSKESLLDHLTYILLNLFCPVCNSKVSSLKQLSDHIRDDNCVPLDMVQTIAFQNTTPTTENNEYQSENNNISTITYKSDDRGVSNTEMVPDNNFTHVQGLELEADVSRIQLDLMKSLQTQELRFLKEDGENRYIIVSEDHENIDQGLVTKQNNDGTISVTSLKDIKSECPREPPEEQCTEQEYSCSTCQMTFTSVYDHINTYHNDQDVVVEGAMPDSDTDTAAIEYEAEAEDANDKHSRRVITETGNIVETPLHNTSQTLQEPVTGSTIETQLTKDTSVKPTRGAKRFVAIDNLCDSVIRDLKPDPEKSGPTHNVVITPALLMEDGSKVKMYHCTSCKIYVNDLSDFKTQTCKPAKYSCNQCSVVYDNAKSLCAHMKVHKVKSAGIVVSVPDVFECEVCCTVFLTHKSLKLHKRMHDPIKSRPIDPPRSSTANGARYKCPTCDKMIPSDYREIHSASHKTDNMLNCTICNKKFSSADYLEMHMNVHNVDKVPQNKSDRSLPYSCLYCDRKFARPHEKVKHERIHTGEKPHECEICGKSFRVSYCLTLHMRTHTGARPYACPHCDKRFKAHSVYNHHLLTHSDVRAYKCPYCPKAFKTSVQLAGHKNSHTKPFACTHCNRPFASLYAVRVHTETHKRQNNLKYRCALCGASYARAFALRDHVKQAHPKVEEDEVKDPLSGNDDWIVQNSESEKDPNDSQEIPGLEIPSDELIVPN